MDPAALYTVEPRLEQLNAMALGSGEVEIKAVLVLDCLMTREQAVTNIRQAVQVPFDPEKIAGMPGIVGYVVQEGDTLWKIAKKFYVSVDSIRRWNEIGEEVSMGDRLILVKQVTK
jgi:nucleoid-associated protein YgaU